MRSNKHKSINYKSIFEKKFIFKIGSNLSFYLSKCFIDQHNIKKYKIIFTRQGGDRNKAFKDLLALCNLCNIDIDKCLILDPKLDYNYLKMFFESNTIIKKIKKFINCKDFIYVTSLNYGMINSLIMKTYGINNGFFIIDDGITNWIKFKIRANIIKSILYSIALKRLIYLSNHEKNNYTQITSIVQNSYQNKFINISEAFKKFLNKDYKKNIISSSTKFNVLILCAKTIHYKNGIINFLLNTRKILIDDNKNRFDYTNTTFHFKMHPGFEFNNKINLEKFNISILKTDILPIEFYNLKNLDLIITPINTSLLYLIKLRLFEKKLIQYYDVFQKDYSEKLKLINPLKIKKFNNNNYQY